MGLHAQIHQNHHEVAISITGKINHPEILQLQAILQHFSKRGCKSFSLDLSKIDSLKPVQALKLNKLIEWAASRALLKTNRT